MPLNVICKILRWINEREKMYFKYFVLLEHCLALLNPGVTVMVMFRLAKG